MKKAFELWKSGKASVYKAAKTFGVPVQTLRYRTLGCTGPSLVRAGGSTKVLTVTDEAALVSFIEDISACGYHYTRNALAELVSETAYFLKRRDDNTIVSHKWMEHFFDRWPALKTANAGEPPVEPGITEESMGNYYRELLRILQKYKLLDKPHRIYGIHDVTVTSKCNPRRVCLSVAKEAGLQSRLSSVLEPHDTPISTVVSSINAAGQVLPPYLVFKGMRLTKDLLMEGLPGTYGKTSYDGYLNSRLWQKYLSEHFLKYVPCAADDPALLLYDGLRPQVNVPLIDWAEEQNIILYLLPPHASRTPQTEDVDAFCHLKSTLEMQCSQFLCENPGRIVTKYDISNLVAKTYNQLMTQDIVVNTFKTMGVVPYNPNIITECLTTSELARAQETAEQESGESSTNTQVTPQADQQQVVQQQPANSPPQELMEPKAKSQRLINQRAGVKLKADQQLINKQPWSRKQPQSSQQSIGQQSHQQQTKQQPQVNQHIQMEHKLINPQPCEGHQQVNPQLQSKKDNQQQLLGRQKPHPDQQPSPGETGQQLVKPQTLVETQQQMADRQQQADRQLISQQPEKCEQPTSRQPQVAKWLSPASPQQVLNPQAQAGVSPPEASVGSSWAGGGPSLGSVGSSWAGGGPSLGSVGSSWAGGGPSLGSVGSSRAGGGPSLGSVGSLWSGGGPSLGSVGSLWSGVGPSLDSVGSSRAGGGPSLGSVGSLWSGVGPSLDSVGSSLTGVGPLQAGVGPLLESVGSVRAGVDPLRVGVGPSQAGVGPTMAGVGTSQPGIQIVKLQLKAGQQLIIPQAMQHLVKLQLQTSQQLVRLQPQAGQQLINLQPQADQKVITPQTLVGQQVINPQPRIGLQFINPQPQAGQHLIRPQCQANEQMVNQQQLWIDQLLTCRPWTGQ